MEEIIVVPIMVVVLVIAPLIGIVQAVLSATDPNNDGYPGHAIVACYMFLLSRFLTLRIAQICRCTAVSSVFHLQKVNLLEEHPYKDDEMNS